MTHANHPMPRPRPRPVKVIGWINLILGAALLMMNWLTINSLVMSTDSSGAIAAIGRVADAYAEAQFERQMERLDALEADAESEPAREVYREERRRLREIGPSPTPAAGMMMLNQRMGSLGIWSFAATITAFVLTLAMIVAGAGLIQRLEWGRRLALWTSGLAIVRQVVLQSIWLLMLVPGMSKAIGEQVEASLAAQGAGAMPFGTSMTQLYVLIYSIWGLAAMVIGSTYPAISMVVLTRPGARAACGDGMPRLGSRGPGGP